MGWRIDSTRVVIETIIFDCDNLELLRTLKVINLKANNKNCFLFTDDESCSGKKGGENTSWGNCTFKF